MRAHIVVICWNAREPNVFPVKIGDNVQMGMNVLGNVRVDSPERFMLCGRISSSQVVASRKVACISHEISCQKLNQVVEDPLEHWFVHDAKYVGLWKSLVEKLKDSTTRKKAMEDLSAFGFQHYLPALLDARWFDGSRDTPQDIQHLLDLGICLFLLENMAKAVHLAFPNVLVQARCKSQIHVSQEDLNNGFIELRRGDEVEWESTSAVQAQPPREKYVFVQVIDDATTRGWVPLDKLIITRTADSPYLEALEKIDEECAEWGKRTLERDIGNLILFRSQIKCRTVQQYLRVQHHWSLLFCASHLFSPQLFLLHTHGSQRQCCWLPRFAPIGAEMHSMCQMAS